MDDGQQVVKVVGNAPCQAAQRLHLLRLLELLLELDLAGYVVLGGHIVYDLALLIANWGDDDVTGIEGAILSPVHKPAFPYVPSRDGLPQPIVEGIVLTLTLEDARVAPDGLSAAVAADLLKSGIDVEDGAIGIGDHDRLGDLLDGSAQALLGFGQAAPSHSTGHLVGHAADQIQLAPGERVESRGMQADAARNTAIDQQWYGQDGGNIILAHQIAEQGQNRIIAAGIKQQRRAACQQTLEQPVACSRDHLPLRGRTISRWGILVLTPGGRNVQDTTLDDGCLGAVSAEEEDKGLKLAEGKGKFPADGLEHRLYILAGDRHGDHAIEQDQLAVAAARLVVQAGILQSSCGLVGQGSKGELIV